MGLGSSNLSSAANVAEAAGGRRSISRRFGGIDLWTGGLLVLVGLSAAIILLLLCVTFALSFLTGMPGDPSTHFSLANYAEMAASTDDWTILVNTIEFGVGTLLVSLFFGLPISWLIERTDFPGKTLVLSFLTLGLLIPGFASAMGWIFMLQPRIGIVNQFARRYLGITTLPFDITSVAGMAWVQGLSLVPLVFVMTAGVFRAADPSLEEAAQAGGAKWSVVLRRITLPLAWPGILAASIYVFTIGFAAFDVPAVIGWSGQIFTFSTYLYVQLAGMTGLPRYGYAAALSTIVIVIAVALSLLYIANQKRAHRYAVVTGKGYRPRLLPLGRWRAAAIAFVALYLILSELLPVLLLAWASLLPFFQLPSARAFSSISLSNFNALPWNLIGTGLTNTVILMVLTPTVTLALSVAFSWVSFRMKFRGHRYADVIAFLPHAVPGIIFGLSALLVALYIARDIVPIYGTIWILLAVFAIARLSYGTRLTNTSLLQMHKELEESARTAGADTGAVLRQVTLPLLAPTLAYAWLWIALLTFRELTLAVVLTTTNNVTLPVIVWSLWSGGGLGRASALAIIMIALLVPLTALYWFFARRRSLVAA